MKKLFIIFSQLREDNKNSESKIPLALPQKQAGKGIHIKSSCSKCGGIVGSLGAGKRPRESSLICAGCKRFISWIGASELAALTWKGGER